MAPICMLRMETLWSRKWCNCQWFEHIPLLFFLGVWLKANFNSTAVGPGKAIRKVSAHLGVAFKFSLSSLVTDWATLQPWPCLAMCPLDPDPDTQVVLLGLTSDLPFLYGRIWKPGLSTEPGHCHWACSGLLAQALWDCPHGATPLPALLSHGSQPAVPCCSLVIATRRVIFMTTLLRTPQTSNLCWWNLKN